VQYREIILDRYPNLSLDLPQLSRLSTSVSSSSHREEIAESRKNAISDLLSHVSGKNDIRDHSATITFLYEDERTIPSSRSGGSMVDSMPIALGGKIKMDIKIDRTLEILIEHCQDLPTLEDSHTAPEPYVKTYLLDFDKEKISDSKRKTTISHRTCHPTFNQVIDYGYIEKPEEKFLEVSVWSYLISGNLPLGKVLIKLNEDQRGWFPLEPKFK